MEKTYKTFIRSCRNWEEFGSGEKIEQETGLRFLEAYEACKEFNSNLTDQQKEAGTKMEFESE